ncbi:MAG TPA: hypothetical protein VJ806_11340 [Luteimonas sp.]|nr:hypothetical protein [Luteimonas sp.]
MKPILAVFASFALAMSIAACKRDKNEQTQTPEEQAGLPAPAGSSGSITGMPDKPGPGQVASVGGEPPPVEIADGTDAGAEVDPANPETGLLPGSAETDSENAPSDATAAPEPTPEDAVAVVRDYYDSINSRSFARAYSLWSDDGRSSGQTPEQFAAGFTETAKVEVEIQPPGRVDAAAGSRYIEVPIAISATRNDGSVRKYVGAYVLRRAVVDGASAEQRAWRIGSADIREVKP